MGIHIKNNEIQSDNRFFFFFFAVMNIALKAIFMAIIQLFKQLHKHRNCKHFPRGKFSMNKINK